MMNAANARFTALILIASLGGCAAGRGAYPSLGPREVEKRGFAEPEQAPAGIATPDPVLDAKLDVLTTDLDRVVADFAKAAAVAQRSAASAKGQKAGTDAWITAQTDLAALDDLHAQTSAAITEIDSLGIDRAAVLAPGYPALIALKTKTQAAFDAQSAMIGRLQASLAPA